MTRLPVLLLCYNRPDLTEKLIEAIVSYAPPKLYVSVDGLNPAKVSDSVSNVRIRALIDQIADSQLVEKRFSEVNEGARVGVVNGIDWFFENEREGIVLEDDCLPSPGFFEFAEDIISHYRANSRVWGCGGFNPTEVDFGGNPYGFIRFALMSGAWATWADRWQRHDRDLKEYAQAALNHYKDSWPAPGLRHGLDWHLRKATRSSVDYWDYQLSWSVVAAGGVWAMPSSNLALNLGFREDATNARKNPWGGATFGEHWVLEERPEVEVSAYAESLLLRRHLRVYRPYFLNFVRNLIREVRLVLKRGHEWFGHKVRMSRSTINRQDYP